MAARVETGEGTTAAPLTVREAVENYIADRDARDSKRKGRPIRSDAGQRLRRYVLGQPARGNQEAILPAPLAAVTLHALEDSDLQDWRDDLPDTLTASAKQRLVNDLKAALNGAYAKHRKQLPPTLADTIKYGLKAEAFDEDDAVVPDSQVLTDAQITALLRAAREIDAEQGWDGDLYRLVVVMAATGARYSQVARLRVSDCQTAHNRLMMPDSRKGKKKRIGTKPIPVEPDVIATLRPAMFRRGKDQWLLERWRSNRCRAASGSGWGAGRGRPAS